MPTPSAPDLIDVHHHLLPPAYLAVRRREVEAISPGFTRVLDWTPEQSLAELDAAGRGAAILSLSVPGVWFGDAAEALRLARISNDYGLDLKRGHPGRFGFFATLPLPDMDASLAEARRILDDGEAAGFGLFTNYGERHLGDPGFAPLFDLLNAHHAVVYVHPTGHACCRNLVADVSPAILEFPFDTTRTVASLLMSGTLARCPEIRFIFSHGGGALPMLASRLTTWAAIRGVASAAEAQRLLAACRYDTASVTNAAGYAALRAFAAPERILFGSDYPYGGVAGQRAELEQLEADPHVLATILAGNAAAMMPPSTLLIDDD